ncbi:hypothetical protein LEP1GSC127_0777 [Leptospira kirschneri str. 200801925]|nr:hypothetical protein LEP1GSC127_0777 [Leptospira kirschneri str. 200801925]
MSTVDLSFRKIDFQKGKFFLPFVDRLLFCTVFLGLPKIG